MAERQRDGLRLASVDAAKARGFSLNISAFDDTPAEVTYGELLGSTTGKHYIVDTSRNGLGPGSTTCNPAGRALGQPPTTLTAAAGADAYLWIKHPGESDGACAPGDLAAGVWSATIAEDLASHAAW